MRVETAEIVDPVPVKGGIINGCARISWDSQKRPLITFHKFDENGKTQAYCARVENGKWKSYQVSDWDCRWYFEGGGSIQSEIHLGGATAAGKGKLALDYDHSEYGRGRLIFDERTLKPLSTEPAPPRGWPGALDKTESAFPGMAVKILQRGNYIPRWETLPPNRDRAREGALPDPSMLRLYELEPTRAN